MSFFEVNKIPLKVLMNDGFNTDNGVDIKETRLLYDNVNRNTPTFYFNTGDSGTEFEVSVLLREDYYYKGRFYGEYLNEWHKNNIVVSVVTDAMDIPNSKYVLRVTGKKQTTEKQSIWKLRFKQYYEDNTTFNTQSVKSSSLSSIDQLLLQYNIIDSNSATDVILALQRKLQQKGCWDNILKEYKNGVMEYVLKDGLFFIDRTPNGKWDSQMVSDLFLFQSVYMDDQTKQGVCDRDTITALIGDSFELNRLTSLLENARESARW